MKVLRAAEDTDWSSTGSAPKWSEAQNVKQQSNVKAPTAGGGQAELNNGFSRLNKVCPQARCEVRGEIQTCLGL